MVQQRYCDLDTYRIGQNVFVSDMRYSPMQGGWSKRSNYFTTDDEETTDWTGIAGEDIDG